MIQLNLLPDIKQEYIKAKRTRRFITLVAFGVTAFSVFIAIVLFVNVKIIQTKRISDLTNSIQTTTKKIESNTNFNKILTVQNQLATLTTLNEHKPIASRLFGYGNDSGFLAEVTPSNVAIGNLTIDYTQNTISIEGTADTIYSVNQFVDTLKFTKYYVNGEQSAQKPAFSNVVLSSFGESDQGKTSYSITFNFDPALFNTQDQITLNVPNIITTRSELDTPPILFNGLTGNNSTGNANKSQQGSTNGQ